MQILKEFSYKVSRLGQRNDNENLTPAEVIIWIVLTDQWNCGPREFRY